MSKRRKPAEPELPLFDLPLFEKGEAGESYEKEKAESVSASSSTPSTPSASTPPTGTLSFEALPSEAPPSAPSPSEAPLLFSDEELAGPAANRPGPEIEAEPEAWIQDRLLGGMADLTLQTATLGLTLVAVQLMGIPVSLEDWPGFAGLMLIFSFLYAVVPLAFWGHTPGMAWVGHSARSESDEPLSFPQTALRFLGALLTVLFLGLPLLLALRGRSLADRLSASKTLHT